MKMKMKMKDMFLPGKWQLVHERGDILKRSLGQTTDGWHVSQAYINTEGEPYFSPLRPESYEGPLPVAFDFPRRNIDSEAASRPRIPSESRTQDNTDQPKLMAQLFRCALTCVFSLFGSFILFLVILFGPEFSQQVSVFVTFLLAVCVGMFLLSLFAFITPVVDVVGLQKIIAVRNEHDTIELEEQRNALARILREAMDADNPKKVLGEKRLY